MSDKFPDCSATLVCFNVFELSFFMSRSVYRLLALSLCCGIENHCFALKEVLWSNEVNGLQENIKVSAYGVVIKAMCTYAKYELPHNNSMAQVYLVLFLQITEIIYNIIGSLLTRCTAIR